MGGIAAIFSKSRVDASGLVAKMLRAMKHRALDGAAIAWDGNIESMSSTSLLDVSPSTSHSAIGYCFTRILSSDTPQPLPVDGGWLCIDGRIVEDGRLAGSEEAALILKHKLTPMEFPSIESETDGAYSICLCMDHGLLVTRDPIGLKPIFIGRRDDLVAVASERKALWAIGLGDAVIFPPGARLEATQEKSVVELPERHTKPAPAPSDRSAQTKELARSVVESVSIQTAGTGNIAAGFSGGVDSAVLAKTAKDAGVDVLLVTVGVGQTREMTGAESAAKAIGLPIVARQLSKADVVESLDHVLWLIEEPHPMKVSVAMAVYWIARTASENGRPVVLLGQGSDELFGGYRRFATILGQQGSQATVRAISESIRSAHEVNFQRDEQAVSSLRAELRLPFATRRMVELAQRVPLEMKVRSPSDGHRKWILREAAVRLGVPYAMAMRPKKAVQYASGVDKAIREIAKQHRLALSTYLERRSQRLKDTFSPRQIDFVKTFKEARG